MLGPLGDAEMPLSDDELRPLPPVGSLPRRPTTSIDSYPQGRASLLEEFERLVLTAKDRAEVMGALQRIESLLDALAEAVTQPTPPETLVRRLDLLDRRLARLEDGLEDLPDTLVGRLRAAEPPAELPPAEAPARHHAEEPARRQPAPTPRRVVTLTQPPTKPGPRRVQWTAQPDEVGPARVEATLRQVKPVPTTGRTLLRLRSNGHHGA